MVVIEDEKDDQEQQSSDGNIPLPPTIREIHANAVVVPAIDDTYADQSFTQQTRVSEEDTVDGLPIAEASAAIPIETYLHPQQDQQQQQQRQREEIPQAIAIPITEDSNSHHHQQIVINLQIVLSFTDDVPLVPVVAIVSTTDATV